MRHCFLWKPVQFDRDSLSTGRNCEVVQTDNITGQFWNFNFKLTEDLQFQMSPRNFSGTSASL